MSFKHSQIDVGGAELHVAEVGEGPPVVFCHGFPAIWSSWRSQMLAVAAAGYRAIAPDMRGYGGSSAPSDPSLYTPFDTVGDLVGMLDSLKLATAVLVGHDFGANVAWNAAMMRPDRFEAVFGISVAYRRPGGPGFLDQLRKAGKTDFYMFEQMRPEADQLWSDATRSIPSVYYWTSGQPLEGTGWSPFGSDRGLLRPPPEALRVIDPSYMREAVETFTRTGFHGGLNYYRSIDLFSRLSARAFSGTTIRQPTFFLYGRRDGLNELGEPDEAEMRKSLPDLRGFIALEGAGHWPQFEAGDRVNRELTSFLATLSAGKPRER